MNPYRERPEHCDDGPAPRFKPWPEWPDRPMWWNFPDAEMRRWFIATPDGLERFAPWQSASDLCQLCGKPWERNGRVCLNCHVAEATIFARGGAFAPRIGEWLK